MRSPVSVSAWPNPFCASDRIRSPVLWIPTMGHRVVDRLGGHDIHRYSGGGGWPVVGVSGALVAQALSGAVLVMMSRRQVQPAIA